MEPTGNSTVSSDRKPIKKTVASSATAKPNGEVHCFFRNCDET
uniref:Uncharacterized protein n=1 Tax=Brassica oleracea TaxID=3712 RepID=A0A3P6GA76_BRAOL|nr:unnamed protein product [Brassica oleracea]